ncbi:MAG TPA: glycosyltransferase family 39 protein, partial [Candidatus Baltobacteraceae bacterium]|nr:glycosyltransferase family 39 protein [Candidatus Baltobacteraceae bacterium]
MLTLESVISAAWRAALIGGAVAAVATLPGLGIGTLWDNSETTYGEVAREVLLYHDPVVLHLNGDPWFIQPPLYFWIAALFAKVLGLSEFALRLPSALATIAMSGAVAYVVARLVSLRAAILSAVVLSTSLMQAVVGRLAIMDALLDLTVALAILAWFATLRNGDARAWYGGWAALGLGALAKGPVAPVVAALVIGVWALWETRTGRRLVWPSPAAWAGGVALFAAIVAPWTIALVHTAGLPAIAELVGHYTFGRYVNVIENQPGPIWYYVPVVVLGFFPWFAYLVPASLYATREARNGHGGLARLALVWAIIPFVFFSFAQTKLPNYIALEFPALAILVGVWFDDIVASGNRRAALLWTAVVPIGLVAVGIAIWAFSNDNRLSHDLQALRVGLLELGICVLLGSLLCFALLTSRRYAWLGPFALGATSLAVMLA